MRKIYISFLFSLLSITLLSLVTDTANAQVPVFGPETFGTSTLLPTGWEVKHGTTADNSWELINSTAPSIGYSNPKASGDSHIKIDASASRSEFLISPLINCSGITNIELRFGAWRATGYTRTLLIGLDFNNDGNFKDKEYTVIASDIPYVSKWGLITIPLDNIIDNKPTVRIRFSHIGTFTTSGPLRIDDITLYGYTSTLPTDYFRTRTSGDWNNTAVWESSRDNIYWMPSTLTPTNEANTITIRNTHMVTNTTSLTVDQLTIDNGGTLILAHDLIMNDGPDEDLAIEEGGALDLSTYQITGTGTIRLNGHLKTVNPDGLYGSSFTGIASGVNFAPPGSNSIIEYDGNTEQKISVLEYSNLIISGSGNKMLAGPTAISNNLQMNGGLLLLGEYYLTVQNSASGSPASYIKINGSGKLTINNVDVEPKTFPIGKGSYNPVTISNGGGLNWTVGIEDHWALSDPLAGTSYDKSVHRTWVITPSINAPEVTADILLEYNDNDDSQIGKGFIQSALVQVWRQAEDNWLAVGVTQSPAGTANGTKTVKISSEALYSLFAIANMNMPLPVKFSNIRAVQQRSAVSVYFTNETESNITQYTLERSGDGQLYKPLQVIRPLKNNSSAVSYEARDHAPEALNLYRVKATEIAGQVTYSSVVRVNIKEGLPRLTVVPNPANKGAVLLQLSNVPQDTYRLNLYDVKGQVLLHQELHHAGGSSSYPLPIENLQPGTYVIELTGKEKLLQRLVIL